MAGSLPTQILDVMVISDPLWDTPNAKTRLIWQNGEYFTPIGEEVNPHLSAKEIKRISRAVHTANFSQSHCVGVNNIFVLKDHEEDLRVECLREALHKDYDVVVMCTELPP